MRGYGLKLRGFTLLFRLEKVYNLVKETMPKKPDGQSGVEGCRLGGPLTLTLAPEGLLFWNLSGLSLWGDMRGCGSLLAALLCPLPSAGGLSSGRALASGTEASGFQGCVWVPGR